MIKEVRNEDLKNSILKKISDYDLMVVGRTLYLLGRIIVGGEVWDTRVFVCTLNPELILKESVVSIREGRVLVKVSGKDIEEIRTFLKEPSVKKEESVGKEKVQEAIQKPTLVSSDAKSCEAVVAKAGFGELLGRGRDVPIYKDIVEEIVSRVSKEKMLAYGSGLILREILKSKYPDKPFGTIKTYAAQYRKWIIARIKHYYGEANIDIMSRLPVEDAFVCVRDRVALREKEKLGEVKCVQYNEAGVVKWIWEK